MHVKSEGVFGTNITNPQNRTEQKTRVDPYASHNKTPNGQLPPEHKTETPWTDHTATEGVMPRCQEDMPVVPPQVVIAQVYPTVYSNKNTMSQHMRHNISTKGSNVYMLNRTNHQHKSPKYSNMYFLQLLK